MECGLFLTKLSSCEGEGVKDNLGDISRWGMKELLDCSVPVKVSTYISLIVQDPSRPQLS